jgi:hypothetical protein
VTGGGVDGAELAVAGGAVVVVVGGQGEGLSVGSQGGVELVEEGLLGGAGPALWSCCDTRSHVVSELVKEVRRMSRT